MILISVSLRVMRFLVACDHSIYIGFHTVSDQCKWSELCATSGCTITHEASDEPESLTVQSNWQFENARLNLLRLELSQSFDQIYYWPTQRKAENGVWSFQVEKNN